MDLNKKFKINLKIKKYNKDKMEGKDSFDVRRQGTFNEDVVRRQGTFNEDVVRRQGTFNEDVVRRQGICKDFMFKKCKRDNCRFGHVENVCFYFWKNGSCKFDKSCTKSHEYKKDEYKSHEYKKDEYKSHEYKKDEYKKDEYKKNKDKYNRKKVKNTECFVPMDKDLVDLRIVCDTGKDDCSLSINSRDLVLAPNVFSDYQPYEIYKRLLEEINNCAFNEDVVRRQGTFNEDVVRRQGTFNEDVVRRQGTFNEDVVRRQGTFNEDVVRRQGIPENELFKMWHGNDKIDGTHLIVDDRLHWKEHCPTFKLVLDRISKYFKMDIKSTRFNYYKDASQWKPFHHDAAAINPQKAKNQNFTVAISFGVTRDTALEHAKTKTVISSPQPDGCIYAFSKDTNVIWRHGILQDKIPQELGTFTDDIDRRQGTFTDDIDRRQGTFTEGRISIIAWGWIDNVKQIKDNIFYHNDKK